jgi:hypothetical protein
MAAAELVEVNEGVPQRKPSQSLCSTPHLSPNPTRLLMFVLKAALDVVEGRELLVH